MRGLHSERIRLLVVDDNSVDRMLYRISLETASGRAYDLVEADYGRKGLELFGQCMPDCLLLDFMLPDITGLEFLATLKKTFTSLPCAVVMLTGIDDQRVAVQAMKEGATDYIPKSENVGTILDHVIAAAVTKHRLQRQYEESQIALAAREHQYRMLLEAMPQLVWTANSLGQLEHANRRWVEYTGQPPGDQRGWNDLLHPDDRMRFRELWLNAVQNNTVFEAEHRLKRAADATYRWHLARAVPVEALEGEIKWFGTSTDIDDQKEAERSLLQRQKWESLGLLAGGIAHDFNNLLVGILGGASYVSDLLPVGHPAQPVLEGVVTASEKAALLTRQMLAYAGKGRFFIEPVDFASLVPAACELVRSAIPATIEVQLDLSNNLPRVYTDSSQIQQVIMNLVLNAVESMPDGQAGRVVVKTVVTDVGPCKEKRASSSPNLPPEGTYVVLEVSDSGRGMDDETKARIFDPFFTTKFTGRGLGLAAVEGIVRSSGGCIDVESKPSKGSTFRVYLPAADGLPQLSVNGNKATSRDSSTAPQVTVLAIDDEELVLRIARSGLENAGFKVLTANNGQTGLSTLRNEGAAVSMVLLDLGMPGMNGKEVLRQMREEGLDVPVLVSSGYSEHEVYEQLDAFEIAGFLPKPFRVSHLVNKVRSILEVHSRA